MSNLKDEKARQGSELLRAVETLERERGIPSEMVFTAIERAIRLAIGKHYGDEDDVEITIDRQKGYITAQKGDKPIDPHSGALGRIAAQAAKQQMIQLFREEESGALLTDMEKLKDQLLPQPGTIQRIEGGAAIVSIGKTEAILPRGEQIPGETPHIGAKIKALVLEVKKAGHRVKVILSRSSPLFVQRLFEREIPEIEDRTIKIERVAREAGYRTKVAVSSIDSRVDCVGACVGVRGSRIKNIVEELGGGERIDIVRWNDSLEVLIRNSLQPADIEEVFLYERLERAIVLVKEDQLSLAIGRRGQNVRLASKLVEWDIEIMTHEELNTAIEKAESQFMELPGMSPELAGALIEEGFLSCEDVAVLTPHELVEMGGLDEEIAAEMIASADEMADQPQEKVARPAKPKADGQLVLPGAGRPADAPSEARQKFESLFAQPADAPPFVTPEEAIDHADPDAAAEAEPPEGEAFEGPEREPFEAAPAGDGEPAAVTDAPPTALNQEGQAPEAAPEQQPTPE